MKIKEIMEVKYREANDKLKEGWELLHVVGLPHGVIYVMALREALGPSAVAIPQPTPEGIQGVRKGK